MNVSFTTFPLKLPPIYRGIGNPSTPGRLPSTFIDHCFALSCLPSPRTRGADIAGTLYKLIASLRPPDDPDDPGIRG